MNEQQASPFNYEGRPWLKFYGDMPHSLNYPDGSMYDSLKDSAKKGPEVTAYEFMGIKSTYSSLIDDIDKCAVALKAAGIKKGDRVAIALPNIPQAVMAFYAANKLGAVCVMIHPLSAQNEVALFLNETRPKALFTLNLLFEGFRSAFDEAGVSLCVLCKINDTLGLIERLGVDFVYRGKGKVIPEEGRIIYWKEFFKTGCVTAPAEVIDPPAAGDCAAILYSGGTSGHPKGMALSNLNFNALARQLHAHYLNVIKPHHSMVAVLPLFHGFGLGCCVHAIFIMGCKTILVPQFKAEVVAKLINKKRPSLIAGPPTLFESLMRSPLMQKTDLSCFIGMFSGGDKLPGDVKRRFDKFLEEHGASVRLREGYGLTETVTACMLTPENHYRPGCIGIPFPDMLVKICEPGTSNEVPVGADGEICLFGPTVMMGYINDDEGTKKVLIPHPDGRTWLHTGDMGYVDEDGFVYFRQRIKRIFKISGYSIYPSMIEETVNTHPAVNMSCAVSVHDEVKLSRVKLYVELSPGYSPSEELKAELMDYCKKHLNVWSVPKIIEFIDKLPVTRVGKVDFKVLQD